MTKSSEGKSFIAECNAQGHGPRIERFWSLFYGIWSRIIK
jgi:hypothetical protein